MRFPLLSRLFEARGKQLSVVASPAQEKPHLDEAALTALCPHIRAILDNELAEGNTIWGGGFSDWPRENSIVFTMNCLFVHTYPTHYPVADPVFYSMFDQKLGDGDSYYCTEHSHLLFAPMPTLKSLGRNKR